MKIANIVYQDELVNHKEVEYINYIKIDDYEPHVSYGINIELPTLIVGWRFLNEIYPNREVNILKHRIEENKLYWEFTFNENKSSHVNGVQSFVENVPNFYFNPRFQYINLDPVFYQLKDNQDLFDVLPKEVTKTYLLKDRMLYAVIDDKIFGLDLDMYRFFKFNVEGIKNKLKEMSFAHFDDPDGEIYEKYYKILPTFSYLKRYIVVLVSN